MNNNESHCKVHGIARCTICLPRYMVAVESFTGMDRQYFDSYACARTEYDRLVKHGRPAYLYCD